MSTTPNLGLPIYGANDTPKWDDTNTPFQTLDDYVALTNKANTFTQSQAIEGVRLQSKSTNIDTTTPPSSATWGDSGFSLFDKNGNRTFFIQPLQNTDGTVDLRIQHDDTSNPNGKIILNGLSVSGYTNVQLVGNFATGHATMQHTGVLCISGLSSDANGALVYKNGSHVGLALHGNGAGHFTTIMLPVSAGDVISTRNSNNPSSLLALNQFSVATLIY